MEVISLILVVTIGLRNLTIEQKDETKNEFFMD